MTQWALWFDASEVQLVRMTESKRGSYEAKTEWTEEVVAKAPIRWRKGKIKVQVDDRAIEVTVDGQRHRFDAIADRSGFCGLQMRGLGYLQISDLKLK